jgi:hypothetical protein
MNPLRSVTCVAAAFALWGSVSLLPVLAEESLPSTGATIGEDGRALPEAGTSRPTSRESSDVAGFGLTLLLPEDGSAASDVGRPTPRLGESRLWRSRSAQGVEHRRGSERLASLEERHRLGSTLVVELPARADSDSRQRADLIAALWNAGRSEEALAHLARLENEGLAPAIALSSGERSSPSALHKPSWPVQLAELGRSVSPVFALDYDAQTGHLFALLAWDDQWRLQVSVDEGATWTQTLEWHGTEIIDVDLAVVGDWAYVLYADASAGGELRLRRFFVTDGSSDSDYGDYGSLIVRDFTPQTVMEVALVANADDSDNGLYCFAQTSSNTIRYLWGNSGGGTFTDASPSLGNVLGGLDAHWNDEADTYFLFMSYLSMDGKLHVWRRGNSVWSECFVTTYSGSSVRTALSAYDETIFCAVEHAYPADYGIRGYVNYDAGSGMWLSNTVAEPPYEGDWRLMADTSARGGGGIAVIYDADNVFNALLRFQNRHTYDYSPWNSSVSIDNVTPGVWTALNWLPPLSGGNNPYGYGMIYAKDGSIYFKRRDGYDPLTGDNCASPIPISTATDLPYLDANTTCNRVNDYDNTAMGTYDDGEDIVYQLTVPADTILDISVTADTLWAGVALFDSCPSDLIAMAASSANPDVIDNLPLSPGVYYLMVDTYPPPECTGFELSITEQPFDEGCPDGCLSSQPPDEPAADWHAGVSDLFWDDGPLQRFANVEVNGRVTALRWWGMQGLHNGFTWVGCDENPMEFEVAFYEDDWGQPGDLIHVEQMTLVGVGTGYHYDPSGANLELYRYDFTLAEPCSCGRAWVSITGVGDPADCWFLWLSSSAGDGLSGKLLAPNDWETEPFDLSLCLIGSIPCPGDLNGDGQRNQADLGILLASYGEDAGGDIDGDGDTDQSDLGVLLANYGVDCT